VSLLDQVRLHEWALIALYFALRPLELPAKFDRTLTVVLLVVLTYRVTRILRDIAVYAIKRGVAPGGEAGLAQRETARNLSYAANVVVWLIGALFILGNLGINVSTVLTGLGIGGVAVALAAQAVLGDFFAAVAIFLDKPFVVGDFIAVDELSGTVERIGIKTTRVRSLTGEMLIFPNSALTSAKLRNYQKLKERWALFDLKISRALPPSKIARVVQIIREVLQKTPQVRLVRANFKGPGDASLDFEYAYYVTDPDYGRYMEVNEAVQLALLETFALEGIELALPTRVMVDPAARA
jgi:small-conductance mechanosensitive channel